MRQILFAAKITLGSLHGDVAQEDLNLLQFAAAVWHNLAQVVRGNMLQRYAAAVPVHNVPDQILTDAFAPYSPILADRAGPSSTADLRHRALAPAVPGSIEIGNLTWVRRRISHRDKQENTERGKEPHHRVARVDVLDPSNRRWRDRWQPKRITPPIPERS